MGKSARFLTNFCGGPIIDRYQMNLLTFASVL